MAEPHPTAVPAVTATPSPIPDEHMFGPIPNVWRMVLAQEFFSVEAKMILSAILIIYVGAHASLRRPPSAAPPTKPKRRHGKLVHDDETFAQGFELTDAIVFPCIAAAVLIGLYYLINWLKDPAILNAILRLYMALTGVLSVGAFYGDVIQVFLNLISPDCWADRSGRVFELDPVSQTHKLLKTPGQDASEKEADPTKRLPLPGLAAGWHVSPAFQKAAWAVRHSLKESFVLKIVRCGRISTREVKITSIAGFLLGIVVEGLYLYTGSLMLSNLIGLSVCYMAFSWMSVTSFLIGSLVLVGLFFYDIVMVFYTPFMVTVATQIEAPLKLTFTGAGGRSSLLGLGDIVIPGIFICLALRFDLWRHYQGKVTYVLEDLETVTKEGNRETVAVDLASTTTAGEMTTTQSAYRTVKAPFVDPRGQWGNLIWTTSPRNLMAGRAGPLKAHADARFPKTYFHATLLGYLLGMLATVVVLVMFKRGQPALLYLVPGVAGSAWLTGVVRGDLEDMWKYTEDGSLDTEEVVVETDGEGNLIERDEAGSKRGAGTKSNKGDKGDKGDKKRRAHQSEGDYELFSLSILLPTEASVKEE